MSRQFVSHSSEQLTAEAHRAQSADDKAVLETLLNELSFRKTPRARALREDLLTFLKHEKSLAIEKQAQITVPLNTHIKPKHDGGQTWKVHESLNPTSEQEQAISFFRDGGSLKINAFAGTGKTSTLVMLAKNTTRRGQYIAFNRKIVTDAKEKFPRTVSCSTTHGLAYRAMAPHYENSSDKLTGKINAKQLAEILGLNKWRVDEKHVLPAQSQGFLILDTIRRFTQSAAKEPTVLHVPRHGSLRTAPASTLAEVDEFVVKSAIHVWQRMQERGNLIPLGHDGYLKLWALSEPVVASDFILLDEAQDTNPVVLELLQKQPAQMIYVGDKHQQIYEWRGAVNAMELMETTNNCLLTTSFRFGDEIANAATAVLRVLGERNSLKGYNRLSSRIGATNAQTVLARTNANTITAVIEALNDGRRPHLVGGVSELMGMLRGVQELKEGQPSSVPEFIGFSNWNEIVELVRIGEGDQLQTFVNLVETRGERQLMWALNRTVDEGNSDLVISTAHKAKGREWDTVRLMDDFLKVIPKINDPTGEEHRANAYAAELRLFYVALTRAKQSIEVPSSLLSAVGAVSPEKQEERPYSNTSAAKLTARETPTDTSWQPPGDWRPSEIKSRSTGGARPKTSTPPATLKTLPGTVEKVQLPTGPIPSRLPGPSSDPGVSKTQSPPKRGLLSWLFGK